MKKVIGALVVFLMAIGFALPADAAGAITANEQKILDALSTSVTVQGKSFSLSGTDIAKAENYLKQHDLTDAEINSVLADIEAAKSLLVSEGSKIDMTNIGNLTDLIKALPRDVINQLKNYVSSAGATLGLTITFSPGGISVVDPSDTGSGSTGNGSNSTGTVGGGTGNTAGSGKVVYTSGSAVKQTGAAYVASALAISSLLIVAAGAVVVGRKTRLA